MKSKRIIRFYFSAEKLDCALDNLIMAEACRTDGEAYFDKVIEIIEKKKKLSKLWLYIDGVMSGLSVGERIILKYYGKMRFGLSRLDEKHRRGIKRAAVKFRRHARFLERYGEGIRLVNEYYALL